MEAFGIKDVRCYICKEPAELYHVAGVTVVENKISTGVILGFYCKNHWIIELANRENMSEKPEESKNNEENPATIQQIIPTGKGVEVGALVKQDIEDRIQLGEKRYGERLKTFNGRSALWDAYQEVLDLANYLRQLIEEEKELAKLKGRRDND